MNTTMNLPTRKKPEVLSPAGNLRGLKTAVDYGADAVYCGGKAFGMRSAPKNLSLEDFEEGSRYAHERGARVYVTCNVLPRNNEVEAMREYLGKLKDTGVDALIVSDIGVMMMARQVAPNLELHVSTQAGVTNYQAANAFYELGARRVVLAREMDLQAVRDIRANIPDDLDIECFVHGAMCMAFSGRCLFSNYLTGRDGNHGECAQPCRWKYSIVEEKRPGQYFPIEQTAEGAYLFNSQDMNMLAHIDDLLDSMRQHKIYLGIVRDENNRVCGIVTIEDFLEELVGEIWDEEDVVEEDFIKLGGNRFLVSPTLTLGDVFERMGVELPANADRAASQPVGVWVQERFGRLPEEDESFMFGNVEVSVDEVSDTRVTGLIFRIVDENTENEPEDAKKAEVSV